MSMYFLQCAWCHYRLNRSHEPGPAKTADIYERMARHIRANHVAQAAKWYAITEEEL